MKLVFGTSSVIIRVTLNNLERKVLKILQYILYLYNFSKQFVCIRYVYLFNFKILQYRIQISVSHRVEKVDILL